MSRIGAPPRSALADGPWGRVPAAKPETEAPGYEPHWGAAPLRPCRWPVGARARSPRQLPDGIDVLTDRFTPDHQLRPPS